MRAGEIATDATRLFLTAGGLYFIAAASTIHLTSNGRDIAAFWPANAILVALLLADERPRWIPVLSAGFLANLAANQITRGTLAGPMLYGATNVIEVALVVALLRRWADDDGVLQTTPAVIQFILIAGLVAPAISGVFGSVTACYFFGEPLLKSYVSWIASDGLGLLVFTPFLLSVFQGDLLLCMQRKTWSRRFEGLGLLLLVGLVGYHVFAVAPRPILFLLFPPLMLVTFRVGHLGTKAAVMIVAIIGGVATMHGYGPVAMMTDDPAEQAHLLQAFLALLLLTCLPVAAEVTARARLAARLDAHDREMTLRATYDHLTGVHNRRGFEEAATSVLERSAAGLIVIDFDHFKSINDRWGHLVGDRALQHLAAELRAAVGDAGVIGRMGGDEFVVLVPGADRDAATDTAGHIRQRLQAAPMTIDAQSILLIGLSIGVASAQAGERLDDVVQRADVALYDAKKAGRNTIRVAA